MDLIPREAPRGQDNTIYGPHLKSLSAFEFQHRIVPTVARGELVDFNAVLEDKHSLIGSVLNVHSFSGVASDGCYGEQHQESRQCEAS